MVIFNIGTKNNKNILDMYLHGDMNKSFNAYVTK